MFINEAAALAHLHTSWIWLVAPYANFQAQSAFCVDEILEAREDP